MLSSIAKRFLARMRRYDRLYRYGGEEFLICLPDTALAEAGRILERLRADVQERPFEIPDHGEVHVTASFGAAAADAEAVDACIAHADRCLFEAKAEGRNRLCLRAPDDIARPFAVKA